MATQTEIMDQVDLLADAYGRSFREDSRHYEAYCIALGDVDASHLRLGATRLLREKLQFMPTPAEMRAHAMAVKDSERVRGNADDERRLNCVRCQDRGYLMVINRRWIAEHRDQFTPDWFVTGWMREAGYWCRTNHGEDILLGVICGCDCRNSQVWIGQVRRWRQAKDDPSVKASRPAFASLYDERYDCIWKLSGDYHRTHEQDLADALLEFVSTNQRNWQGNWTP